MRSKNRRLFEEDRRFFLRGCAALGTLGLTTAMTDLRLINAAAAQSSFQDFKALVCCFNYGGTDSMQFLCPTTGSDYDEYAQARQNLAYPKEQLLSIGDIDGREFGMPGEFQGLHTLYQENKLAMVANIGTLLYPVTLEEARDRAFRWKLPRQLYSHNSQQEVWQTSRADTHEGLTGWGGRMADLVDSLNHVDDFAMNFSLGGFNRFQVGEVATQYHLGPTGAVALKVPGEEGSPLRSVAQSAMEQLMASTPHLMGQYHRDIKGNALDKYQLITDALGSLSPLATAFPASRLGSSLRMAAQMIAAGPSMGFKRMCLFVSEGGWDTHGGPIEPKLGNLGDSLTAFTRAVEELGISDKVTLFTASDFGRTFNSNGTGSDHGWGGNQMVMGGAVKGGKVYGTIPRLVPNSPDFASRRAFMPTTAVDSYNATLATWFGVSNSDLSYVLPHISRFPNDLGFMG
ncbi:MAG: DUF1501 domain-containing protein [Candidatus Competibacterales bacterium]